MKEKIRILLVAMMMMCLLVACGCEHEWAEATCEEPKTCTKCGETEGEVSSEHAYVEATCEAPKTCEVCGITEGDVLEHTWGEWSVDGEEQVRVCSVCYDIESKEIDRAEIVAQQLVGNWVSEFMAGEGFETVGFPYYYLEFRADGTATLIFDETFENHWEFVEFHDGQEVDVSMNQYVMYLTDYNGNTKGRFWFYEDLTEADEDMVVFQYSEGINLYFVRL